MRMLLLVLLSSVLMSACSMTSWKGTDTGNPDAVGTPIDGVNPAISNPTDPASLVALRICNKLKQCFPSTDVTGCSESVMMVAGLAPALGYRTHSTFNEVLNDMTKNVDSSKLSLCSSEIEGLSCSSSSVTMSFSAGSSDYSRVGEMLTGTSNCSAVGF